MFSVAKGASIGIILIVGASWMFALLFDNLDEHIDRATATHPRGKQAPFPDDKFHHLHWFMQISDVHISKFYGNDRVSHFREFCQDYVLNMKPEVVLVTGDITDAKHADLQGSTQFEDEWQQYDQILRETGVTKQTVWLDVRGNHDAFDVPSLDSSKNFHRVYSHQGKLHKGSYKYVHKSGQEEFSFIAVDACPDPGPRRPFNFFGTLTEEQIEELNGFAQESRSSNMSIWFGHYPTPIIGNPSPGIKDVMSSSAVYLCGHLHNLGGLVPRMYSMHKKGNLELELGDWKDHRMFRLFASDHDLFSFTDEVFGSWPIILITNPKDAKFNLPLNEPTGRQARSTHIRVLVFSSAKIEKVSIKLDGIYAGDARHVEGPLYVLPWSPQDYDTGVHHIEVSAQDADGRERKNKQPFSLTNEKVAFSFLPRVVLLGNHITFMRTTFGVVLACLVIPLIMMRFIVPRRPVNGHYNRLNNTIYSVARKLYFVSREGKLYYPLLLFTVYIAIGPWFVGEILEGHIGACFLFGLFVKNMFIPGYMTYIYGFFQLLTFNFPLAWYLGTYLEKADGLPDPSILDNTLKGKLRTHRVLYAVVIWQFYLAIGGYLKAYGVLAFLLCPVRTWAVFLALYLHRQAMHVASFNSKVAHKVSNGVMR